MKGFYGVPENDIKQELNDAIEGQDWEWFAYTFPDLPIGEMAKLMTGAEWSFEDYKLEIKDE